MRKTILTEDTQWYYSTDGAMHEGPISWASVCALHRAHHLTDATLVWCDDLPEWVALRQVLTQNRPNVPPLPKAGASGTRSVNLRDDPRRSVAPQRGEVPGFLEDTAGEGRDGADNAAFDYLKELRSEEGDSGRDGGYTVVHGVLVLMLVIGTVLALIGFA